MGGGSRAPAGDWGPRSAGANPPPPPPHCNDTPTPRTHPPIHPLLPPPGSAPTLQSLQAADESKLSDNDREFAACLAAPPELEERVWSGSVQGQQRLMRLTSMVRPARMGSAGVDG